MKLIDLNLRVGLLHVGNPFIPVRHGNRDAIALGGRGEVFFGALVGQLVGKSQDAIGPVAGHDRLLNNHLSIRASKHHAANRGILALSVLPNHIEIDVARLPPRQGRSSALS